MSRRSRSMRPLAFAGLAAVGLLGGAASSAQAVQTTTLTYACKYPVIGTQPVSVKFLADVPDEVALNEATPKYPVTALITAGGATSDGLALFKGAAAIEGVATGTTTVLLPLGGSNTTTLALNVAKTPLRVDPLVLRGTGALPSLVFEDEGQVKLALDKFALNLKITNAAGEPIILTPRVLEDLDGNPVVDSDGSAETFDVPCKLDSGQESTLATLAVTASGLGPVGDVTTRPAKGGTQLCWGAAAHAVAYDVVVNGPAATSTYEVKGATCLRLTGLTLNQVYTATVTAIGADGARSAGKSTSWVPDLTIADSTPPTKPTLTATPGLDKVTLNWSASTDDSGIDGYDVFVDDSKTKTKTVTSTTTLITGLATGNHKFKVVARDIWDNTTSSDEVSIFTGPVCAAAPLPPTKPGLVPFQPGDLGPTSIHLRWTASSTSPGCGAPATIASYRIRQNGVVVATVPGTTTDRVVTGLSNNTAYRFEIVAVDSVSLESEPLVIEASTTPIIDDFDRTGGFSVTGAATLKTLVKGNVNLTGSESLTYKAGDHSVTGDLKLATSSARLVAGGFLPLTAKVGFVASGATTGTLVDGVLSTTTKARIKVLEVKLFGAIPLAGGNNCQTKSLSTIALKSTTPFSFNTGGTLAGTFAMSDLNGCGPLNGLVSPLTAGSGNTVTLKLTPKVPEAPAAQ